MHIVISLVHLLITFFEITLCISAIISWFPAARYDNKLVLFLDRINGPVLFPARLIVDRVRVLDNFPIDVTYIITFIWLSVLGAVLPVVII